MTATFLLTAEFMTKRINQTSIAAYHMDGINLRYGSYTHGNSSAHTQLQAAQHINRYSDLKKNYDRQ